MVGKKRIREAEMDHGSKQQIKNLQVAKEQQLRKHNAVELGGGDELTLELTQLRSPLYYRGFRAEIAQATG